MKRHLFSLIFVLLAFIFLPVFAENIDSVNFNLQFVKSGITEFYFTDPVSKQKLDNPIAFALLSEGSPLSTSVSVGVHYQIFSIDGKIEPFNVEVGVIASSTSTSLSDNVVTLPTSDQWMLGNITNTNFDGLNYLITANIGEGAISCGFDGSINDLQKPLPLAERKLVLYTGLVDPEEGISDDVILNMELYAPYVEIEVGGGEHSFSSSTSYRGYLTLYVAAL